MSDISELLCSEVLSSCPSAADIALVLKKQSLMIADAWCLQGRRTDTQTLYVFWVPSASTQLPALTELLDCYKQWQLLIDWPGEIVWTAVNRLPFTHSGQVDESALQALPIWNIAEQSNWCHQVQILGANIPLPALAVTMVATQIFGHSLLVDEFLPGQSASSVSPSLFTKELSPSVLSTADLYSSEAATPSAAPWAISAGPSFSVPASERPAHLPALFTTLNDNALMDWVFYDAQGQIQTYAPIQLWAAAHLWAKRLLAAGLVAGSVVIIQQRSRWDFMQIFWGCQLAGLLPVAIATPPSYAMAGAELRHLQNVVQKLKVGAMVIGDADAHEARLWKVRQNLDGFKLFTLGELQSLSTSQVSAVVLPVDFDPDAPAFMMFTSGSTGNPKGVPLTHRQLVLRILCTIELEQLQRESCSLNWMPLDHVAGLLMSHLRDVAVGCQQLVVATEYILEDPLRWLILIDQYRVTTTFAPNFAFNLVMDHAERFADYQWDLSCLHHILDGGEAVVPSTARRFLQGVAHFGVAESALWPAWGMSETTSGVTYNRRLQLAQLSSSATSVSTGPPFPETHIRIVDAQNQLLREGQEGCLQISGNMVFNGYWDAAELNADSFTEDGWFRTGDLAIIVAGELTITGRDKDVIIINGINYAGTAIEMAVDQIPGVETSFTAACAVNDSQGQEQLALFFVPKSSRPEVLLRLMVDIRRAVQTEVGLQPAFLLPLKQEDIPKTSIGKIQRTQLKNAFTAGQFYELQCRMDVLEGSTRTLPNWFMQRVWQAQILSSQRYEHALSLTCPSLSLRIGALGLTDEQLEQLRLHPAVKQHSILKPPAIEWLRLCDQEDWSQSIGELDLHGIVDGRFLAVSSVEDAGALIPYWQQLISSSKQLNAELSADRAQPLAWWVLTKHAYRLPGDKVATGTQSALAIAVWVQTLAQTLTTVSARHVDLPGFNVEIIAAEVCDFFAVQQLGLPSSSAVSSSTRVWRSAGRELLSYVPAMIEVVPRAQPASSRLCAKGAILISGALGGLGQQLVGYLLAQTQSPLILLGRRDESEAIARLLNDICEQAAGLEIEQRQPYRARLSYLQSDLTDVTELSLQLQQLLQDCPLAGMFHLAGQYRECLLDEENTVELQVLLAPKIRGTQTLLALLALYPQAYVVGFSSVVALLGGSTLGGYTAANAYLDALLADYAAQGYDCLSLQWASWRNQGLSQVHADSLGLQPEILAAKGVASMLLQPALASLTVALQQPAQTLAIGLYADHPENRLLINAAQPVWQIQAYMAQEDLPVGLLPELLLADSLGQRRNLPLHWLPSLPLTATGEIDYVALAEQARPVRDVRPPQNALEHKLLELWQLCLKQNDISVTDAFFSVGGQSLVAMRLLGLINAEFSLNWSLPQLLRHSSIAAQAVAIAEQQAEQGAASPSVSAPNTNSERDIPIANGVSTAPIVRQPQPCEWLSDAQQRIWLVCQMDPASHVFHVPAQIILDERVDVTKAQAALDYLWWRHDALRSCFPVDVDSGKPLTRWLDLPNWPFEIVEVSQDVDWITHTRAFSLLSFNLQTGPLCRAQLALLPNGQGRLLLSLHHIITDGWSMKVIFDEWLQRYDHPHKDLPVLPIRYADFVAWNGEQQNNQPQSVQFNQQLSELDYWQQQLQGAEQGFCLPSDFPRPKVQRYQGKSLHQFLAAPLAEKLRVLAQKQQMSAFVLFLAAYKVLLARYSQQQEIILGIMIANREKAEVTGLVGMFINPLVLRSRYVGEQSFIDWMQVVQEVSWQAYEHNHVPFEKVVERLQLARDTSRSPLFQMAFDYRDPQIILSPRNGIRLQVMEPDLNVVQFDLQLTVQEQDGGVELIWHWNPDLFADISITQLASNYQQLLSSISKEPLKPMHKLTFLTSQQQQQLKRLAHNPQEYPQLPNFIALFKQQVHQQPLQIAVEMAELRLTYQQLDQQSDQWAQYLSNEGVQPGDLVAIALPPAIERVVAVLAVLKVAAAYLPLDPHYPSARLNFMLADAQATWLITDEHSAVELITENLRTIKTTDLMRTIPSSKITDSSALMRSARPDDIAYMIYTSGSTGKPKGVRVPHRGWVNVAFAQQQVLGMQSGWRVLQFAAFSFDAAAFELAMALGNGGTLCIATREQLLPGADLYRTFQSLRIQVATLAPTALLEMPDANLPDLQLITVAGEACPQVLPQRFAIGRRFFNLYGPTETTIWASYYQACADEAQAPPIGKPVPNAQLWVLDEQQQLLPQGMPGMLYVGGVGVAEGYHGYPDLTAERFKPIAALQNLLQEGSGRIYQTGDWVKWNADGQLVFLGRVDDQVKVRGFRIELGEIESRLLQLAEVQSCVVIVDKDQRGDRRIIAYVVAKNIDQRVDAEKLRANLLLRLPEFMLPNGFVQLQALPLSPTGKVDKRALPDFDEHVARSFPCQSVGQQQGVIETSTMLLASDPLEKQLSLIWQQTLGLKHLDITKNFFDLGGHSMKLAQVRNQIQQQLQREVPLVVLFQYPTVARLAAYLREAPAAAGEQNIDEQKHRQQAARQRLLQQRNRQQPKR